MNWGVPSLGSPKPPTVVYVMVPSFGIPSAPVKTVPLPIYVPVPVMVPSFGVPSAAVTPVPVVVVKETVKEKVIKWLQRMLRGWGL